MEGNEVLVKLK